MGIFDNEKAEAKKRLEELRNELKAETISYLELAELQSLSEYIDKNDVELLEAAGIKEAKNQYYFNVERKITTWVRERHSISAESKEDAIKQMIILFKEDELDDSDTYVEQEHLYDCDTCMDIEDNNGQPTSELYFDGTFGDSEREFIIDNLNKNEI